MKSEYDRAFEKEFGKIENGALIPPTSSCYTKVSSILSNNANVAHNIQIQTFHEIAVELNVQHGRGRRNEPRTQKLVVSVEDSKEYREKYQQRNSESRKKQIIEDFWLNVVYPKAFEIWNRQTVMIAMSQSQIINNESLNNENRLKLRRLTKTNSKDKWGADRLGNAMEE